MDVCVVLLAYHHVSSSIRVVGVRNMHASVALHVGMQRVYVRVDMQLWSRLKEKTHPTLMRGGDQIVHVLT